jgi:hypothetical protein
MCLLPSFLSDVVDLDITYYARKQDHIARAAYLPTFVALLEYTYMDPIICW